MRVLCAHKRKKAIQADAEFERLRKSVK